MEHLNSGRVERRPSSTLLRELEQGMTESLAQCTLLGPEGPGRGAIRKVARLTGAIRTESSGPFVVWTSSRGRYRPQIENYTVDASILDIEIFPISISQDLIAA